MRVVRYRGFNYLRHVVGASMFENGLELRGGFVRNSDEDHCILDFTKYTSPGEAYSLFVGSLTCGLPINQLSPSDI